jgi:phage terminase large subunit
MFAGSPMHVALPNGGWEPRKHQRKFWNALDTFQFSIMVAHRRWGKDDVLLHKTCIKAHERIGAYWHCLPEYAQARKAIWAAVNARTGKRRIDEAFPHELRAATNEQEMFIRFKNGSTWQCIGSDRFDSTVGAGPVGLTYSEWALANPSAWAYHRPMIVENKGWAAFITTPRGDNHCKKMLERAMSSDLWFGDVSDVSKTGALTEADLQMALEDYTALYGDAELAQAQIDQEYHCSFTAAIPGAFYGTQMRELMSAGRIRACKVDPRYPVNTAWDLGMSDATAIWFWQLVGTQMRIVGCYSNNMKDIDHYRDVIFERSETGGYRRGIDLVPHDATPKIFGMKRTRLETMADLGLKPRVVPMHKIDDGRNAVRRLLPFCVFDADECEAGLSALQQYRRKWDDKLKTFIGDHVHDWASHFADAFRYLAMGYEMVHEERDVKSAPPPQPGVVIPPRLPADVTGLTMTEHHRSERVR